jgi:hypothetical protein
MKKQYTTIGKLIEKEDGKLSIKIDTIPLGWDGWATPYDRDEKSKSSDVNDVSNDLPF